MKVLGILLLSLSVASGASKSILKSKGGFAKNFFLLVAMHHKNPYSIVICPFSMRLALSLLYISSSGNTTTRMMRGLQLRSISFQKLALSFNDLLEVGTYGNSFKVANRLYVHPNTKLSPAMIDFSSKFLKTDAVNINFQDRAKAVNQINEWLSNSTDRMLQRTIPEKFISEESVSWLVSGVYFKSRWPQSEKDIRKRGNFHLNAVDNIEVELLEQQRMFSCGEIDEINSQAAILPLGNGSLSMLVLVPNNIDGLHELEKKLRPVGIQKIPKLLTHQCNRVTLPPIKVQFKVPILKSLSRLGLKVIFHKPSFDTLKTDKLHFNITNVVHHVVFEIENPDDSTNNKDIQTESTTDSNSELHFKADRPFIFFVWNMDSIFFAGRIMNFSYVNEHKSTESFDQLNI